MGRFAKTYLLVVNTVFVVVGLALGCAGAYAAVKAKDFQDEASGLLENVPIRTFAIVGSVVGFAVAGVSLMGLCGAMYKRRGCLCFYILALAVLITVQVAMAGLVLTFDDRLDDFIIERWEDPENTDRVADFQRELDCCDYPGANPNPQPQCPTPLPDRNCRQAIVSWLDDNVIPIAIVGIILSIIQIIALFAAISYLCTRGPKQQEREEDFYDYKD